MITRLAIAGYRSLRDIRLWLGPLTVVTGPNGSGKSSLYRALRLLADVAQGRIIPSLAASNPSRVAGGGTRSASSSVFPARTMAMPSTSACRLRTGRL